MKYLVMLLLVLAVLSPSVVLADDGMCSNQGEWPDSVNGEGITILDIPPGLDEQQAQRWLATQLSSRQYLARMYGIPIDIAKQYGVPYETTYGMPGLYFIGSSMVSRFDTWGIEHKIIKRFEPIPVEFHRPAKPEPIVVAYDAPPQLDIMQQARWSIALPFARPRLAQLYGVDKETAIEYGAEY